MAIDMLDMFFRGRRCCVCGSERVYKTTRIEKNDDLFAKTGMTVYGEPFYNFECLNCGMEWREYITED